MSYQARIGTPLLIVTGRTGACGKTNRIAGQSSRTSSGTSGTKSLPSAPRPCSQITAQRGSGPVSRSMVSSRDAASNPVPPEKVHTAKPSDYGTTAHPHPRPAPHPGEAPQPARPRNNCPRIGNNQVTNTRYLTRIWPHRLLSAHHFHQEPPTHNSTNLHPRPGLSLIINLSGRGKTAEFTSTQQHMA